MNYLIPSKNPLSDIERVSYAGQDPTRKMYRAGYEPYFSLLPVLKDEDPFLDLKLRITKVVMQKMAQDVTKDNWMQESNVVDGGFERTILAMEEPLALLSDDPKARIIDSLGYKEGTEIVAANWGDGHSSPVHGHANGYLHEEILFGKMRVNTFRIIDNERRIVRPIKTEIVKAGTFASIHTKKEDNLNREALVHNFTAIGRTGTLHYLPEHTRDGRDNGFKVERFAKSYDLNETDVTQISGQEALHLPIGSVMLVRSTNVPEYGDHYVIITGPPVIKDHGMRPEDVSIFAPDGTELLDKFPVKMGLTLLKLNIIATSDFLRFHKITVENGKVTFAE